MVTGSAPAPVAEAELDVSPTDTMAILTHVLFNFFGTLVAYSESRVEQGFQRSYEVLVTAGTQVDYSGFLERWSGTFEEFEMRAQHSLDEYSMNDVWRSSCSKCCRNHQTPTSSHDFEMPTIFGSYIDEYEIDAAS